MTTDSENIYMDMVVVPATSDALTFQTKAQQLSDRHMHCFVVLLNLVTIEPRHL
jgi:hypothetical protein